MASIEYEAQRQVDVLEAGGRIVQETRLFNPDTGTTRSMRSTSPGRKMAGSSSWTPCSQSSTVSAASS
jgi:hypothetical protein